MRGGQRRKASCGFTRYTTFWRARAANPIPTRPHEQQEKANRRERQHAALEFFPKNGPQKYGPAVLLMIRQLISSAWDDGLPASLSEEALIAHNWLADGSPTVLACAESVHRRALFDAVNEVLAELRSAPAAVPVRSSGAQQLSLLVQGMRQQRTAQLDLEGAVAQVLRALPTAGLRMPQASDAPFFPEVDDVGAIARAAWERLAHEWRAFGDDEWRQAVAAIGEEGEEEEGEEGRARRAHALFWEGRRRLLLSEAELHETLWASLSEHVSPPWEPPPQGSEVPPPPKRLPAALGGPADEPEARWLPPLLPPLLRPLLQPLGLSSSMIAPMPPKPPSFVGSGNSTGASSALTTSPGTSAPAVTRRAGPPPRLLRLLRLQFSLPLRPSSEPY